MINRDEYSWQILKPLRDRVIENQKLNNGGLSQRHIINPQSTG